VELRSFHQTPTIRFEKTRETIHFGGPILLVTCEPGDLRGKSFCAIFAATQPKTGEIHPGKVLDAMKNLVTIRIVAIALASCGCFGCRKPAVDAAMAMPAPQVTVAPPTQQEVTDYVIFTGRAEPREEVEIRSRVSGQLLKVLFEPGTEVAEGTPLFEIDPAPFRAELAMAIAKQSQAQAAADRAVRDFVRSEQLKKNNAGSDAEYDQALSAKEETAAALEFAKSQVSLSQLNLDYTSINAPLAGRIGDRRFSEGNFITGGTSLAPPLASIVALDPISISFEIDEGTLQNVQRAVAEGRIEQGKVGEMRASAGLAIDAGEFPLSGIVNFFDNRIDEKTGTLRAKADFDNPLREKGGRLISPGMFVRIRLPLGKPHAAMLIPESAIGSDQGMQYLMIVDSEKKAQRLNVKLGATFGLLKVVESVLGPSDPTPRSLTADDRVIVRGLQRVRPGIVVDAK
jgi:RND family efflux transporter MFP subunit